MIAYPSVKRRIVQTMLVGIPVTMKSLVVRYCFPRASSSMAADMFGNPETGSPIPAEQARPAPITSKFGCGCGKCWPTCCTIGMRIRAATVCDTNVEKTSNRIENMQRMLNAFIPSMPVLICIAMSWSNPDDVTAKPRAIPPCARTYRFQLDLQTFQILSNITYDKKYRFTTTLQRKECKSSLPRILVPKNINSGIAAMIPVLPI